MDSKLTFRTRCLHVSEFLLSESDRLRAVHRNRTNTGVRVIYTGNRTVPSVLETQQLTAVNITAVDRIDP